MWGYREGNGFGGIAMERAQSAEIWCILEADGLPQGGSDTRTAARMR